MSAHVVRRLNSRREEDRIPSWDILYRALFPEEQHIPSPYFEPPEETICSKIRKCLNDALPALEQEISGFAPTLRNAIMNAVRGHQDRVLNEFETSLQPKAGSKRSSTPENQGASAKRPRISQDHPSLPSPSPQFSPLPQHQLVQHQAADQGWIDVSRASDPQPQPLNNASAMFMPQQHEGIMNAMPESSSAYLSVSGSQLADPGNFQVPADTYELGSMGDWSTALSTNMNPYQFNDNYYPPESQLRMTSDSTVVDEDTGSYADLGDPSHHA